jgi:hypothetical protein
VLNGTDVQVDSPRLSRLTVQLETVRHSGSLSASGCHGASLVKTQARAQEPRSAGIWPSAAFLGRALARGPRAAASLRPAPAEYPLQGAARWDLARPGNPGPGESGPRFPVPAESGIGDSLFPGQIGDSLPDSRQKIREIGGIGNPIS